MAVSKEIADLMAVRSKLVEERRLFAAEVANDERINYSTVNQIQGKQILIDIIDAAIQD